MTDSTTNQYAPPLAHVADTSPSAAVGELKLFSSKGRIGRLRYLAYATGASFVYNIILSVLSIGLAGSNALTVAMIVGVVALLWFSIISGIKRCHDVNISGWWMLTAIVPVIALVLIFWPGSRGENRFGAAPPPNTLGVRLLGLILPVIALIGILAAIAIPSYKNYTDRARAAQAAGPK
jgi:uncharacterized membrane protein YhaH (DUF805 family)